MSFSIADLNSLGTAEAERELLNCCGSMVWAVEVAKRRPFKDLSQLNQLSDEIWNGLSPKDWLEAFSHHPRIGEKQVRAKWAAQEQKGVAGATEDVLQSLVKGNEAYEKRFGHIFLICATGKSAQEMLEALNKRLKNNADLELKVAASEQAKITKLRLEKLFHS